MKTLTDFALKEEYKHLEYIGDKLAEIDSLIDWRPFRTILESMYSNKTVSGGRPEPGQRREESLTSDISSIA